MGKDMASFTIADQNQPKTIAWEINPLIYKLYNAQQQGDYQHGIAANIPVDEMQSLPLKPIADPDDPLIACALQLLRGSAKIQTQHSASASAYKSRGINYLYYDSHIARAQHSRVLINKK